MSSSYTYQGHHFNVSSDCPSCSSCVGVAIEADAVLVTNTSDPQSPITRFTHDEWRAFIGGVQKGEFSL